MFTSAACTVRSSAGAGRKDARSLFGNYTYISHNFIDLTYNQELFFPQS